MIWEMCIKGLWDDMSRKIDLLKELYSLVKALKNITNFPVKINVELKVNMEFQKIHNKIDRLLIHNNRIGYHII